MFGVLEKKGKMLEKFGLEDVEFVKHELPIKPTAEFDEGEFTLDDVHPYDLTQMPPEIKVPKIMKVIKMDDYYEGGTDMQVNKFGNFELLEEDVLEEDKEDLSLHPDKNNVCNLLLMCFQPFAPVFLELVDNVFETQKEILPHSWNEEWETRIRQAIEEKDVYVMIFWLVTMIAEYPMVTQYFSLTSSPVLFKEFFNFIRVYNRRFFCQAFTNKNTSRFLRLHIETLVYLIVTKDVLFMRCFYDGTLDERTYQNTLHLLFPPNYARMTDLDMFIKDRNEHKLIENFFFRHADMFSRPDVNIDVNINSTIDWKKMVMGFKLRPHTDFDKMTLLQFLFYVNSAHSQTKNKKTLTVTEKGPKNAATLNDMGTFLHQKGKPKRTRVTNKKGANQKKKQKVDEEVDALEKTNTNMDEDDAEEHDNNLLDEIANSIFF